MTMNKQELQEYYAIRYRDRRIEFINLLGGVCVSCGENNYDLLEFDHIDPTTKKYTIAYLIPRRRLLDIALEELKKCQLLCYDCHLIKTSEDYADKREHGTHAMYDNGCHCNKCSKFKNEYLKEYRHKMNPDLKYREQKHGTRSMYNRQACRCEKCVKANSDYKKAYAQRNKEQINVV